MYFATSYEQDFDDLMMHLKAKYPKELFNLEGIGKQLDMCEFSRNFFSSKVTADASIDANANVDDISVIAYNTELPKPFFKINSYYVLWKEIKRLYGMELANKVVEMQLTGDIYIHDFHGVAAGEPYSYYGKTVLAVKVNEEILYTTIEELYDILKNQFPETIIDENATQVGLKNVQIVDDGNKWTNVSRILKHRSHTNLIGLETKNGCCTIVTSDHPVILDDNEKYANQLCLSDRLKISNNTLPIGEDSEECITEEYAYFIGFLIGDGWLTINKGKNVDIRSANISIRQNDIENTKIYKIVCDLFDNVRILKDGTQITFGYKSDVEKLLSIGIGSQNKKMPNDILNYGIKNIKSLIAGIIDSDGNINTNGVCTIRLTSFALIQQLGELFRTLGLGKTRTSFCGRYHSVNGYKSNFDIYRLSCRLTDKDLILLSDKVFQNQDTIYKNMNVDGRFETNELHKIIELNTPEYVYDITTETGHFHCQGLIQHNCFNYTTYDIMTKGLPMVKKVKSLPPKYLYSFKSQLEQFTVIASNSTLGATGLADMLVVMSYYMKNILENKADANFHFATEEDCWKYLKENLVSFIYTINQPMRANQSPFTNVSVYDKYFLEKLAGDYIFPDGSSPDIEVIQKIQDIYLDIMNEELRRTPLTFPVTTACFSIDEDKNIKDEEFLRNIAEKNKEFGFINIYCGDSSTLSSCCRLRSEQKSEYFNSFGSGSSKIGSLGVVSINFPRLAIKYQDKEEFLRQLEEMVVICAKINNAKRKIVNKRILNGNAPLYTLGYMDLSKQYSTCGVNGFNECIEILGENILEEDGQKLALEILDTINGTNAKMQKQYDAPHNCEQVPGENMSIKMASKDKLMGYQDKYDIYSNQFIPLITNADLLDRIKLQGLFDSHFSGGAICHLNVDSPIEKTEDIMDLIRTAAKMGVVYHAINYVLSECEDGHMTVSNDDVCTICGKNIVNKYTRVVGFLTNVKNWHKVRREQDFPNRQFYEGNEIGRIQGR